MFREIVSMPAKCYLGWGRMMPWEDNLEIQFNLWDEAFASGVVDRLKALCGSEQVIGIFCYRCDAESRTFSYHIACENKQNAVISEFESLPMKALNFARFERDCPDGRQKYAEYNALCGEVWGEWLPRSGFVSQIELETLGCVEGYALLERYTPENPAAGAYHLEMFLPVEQKQPRQD